MVLFQKWPFFQLFFWRTIDQEIVFYDILERKNAFLGYKNKKFKKSKNWLFSKGVNPWFWSKNGHFSNFFFYQYRPEKNIFYVILKRKNAFPGYKKKKFKKSKNENFSKGVKPWFWPKKLSFFQVFFFINIRQENVFYVILKQKDAFLGHKNKKFKKLINWHFSKGVNTWFWSKNGHFSIFFF